MKPFTTEQKIKIEHFVQENINKLTIKEMAEKLDISTKSVERARKRLNLQTPKHLKFVNNKTLFKKYGCPHNKKPIGYEFFSENSNQVYVKVKDGKTNNFRLKKVVVWENTYGKIPKGYVVRHKDKDQTNNSIENLYICSRAELLNENSFNTLPNEIRTNCNLLAKIKREILNEHS